MLRTKALRFCFFTSESLLHCAFILLSLFDACFGMYLLLGHHSNSFTAESLDLGTLKPFTPLTIEFQKFLFSKALGHSATGLHSSGLGGGPRLTLPLLQSLLFFSEEV